jgi:hypothetical protein
MGVKDSVSVRDSHGSSAGCSGFYVGVSRIRFGVTISGGRLPALEEYWIERPLDPISMSPLGAQAVMLAPNRVPHLIEQFALALIAFS